MYINFNYSFSSSDTTDFLLARSSGSEELGIDGIQLDFSLNKENVEVSPINDTIPEISQTDIEKTEEKAISVNIDGNQLLASMAILQKNDQAEHYWLKFSHLSLKVKRLILGQGSFSKVRLIHYARATAEYVIKQSIFKKSTGYSTERAVLEDYQNHVKITQNGKIWGIQQRPGDLILIRKTGALRHHKVGYLCERYSCDLYHAVEKFNLQIDDKLLVIQQLLSALAYFETHRLFDYDRKATNFLFKMEYFTEMQFPLAHFSDFGGTSCVDDWDENQRVDATSVCKYRPEHERFNGMEFKDDPEAYRSAAMQLPIFSYGSMIYSLLTGTLPFNDFDRSKGFSGQMNRIDSTDIPDVVKEIVYLMLDTTQTRSGCQIKHLFENYLKTSRLELFEKIELAKNRLGYAK